MLIWESGTLFGQCTTTLKDHSCFASRDLRRKLIDVKTDESLWKANEDNGLDLVLQQVLLPASGRRLTPCRAWPAGGQWCWGG